jgi:hypothetical protein
MTCLIARHAARLQFVGSFLDVLSDFFGEFRVTPPSSQDSIEPVHSLFILLLVATLSPNPETA